MKTEKEHHHTFTGTGTGWVIDVITKRLDVDKVIKAASAELEAALFVVDFVQHTDRAMRLCAVISELNDIAKHALEEVEEVRI